MTKKEAIDTLKLMQAQVEWDYPMDYAVAIDMAIAALAEETEQRSFSCSQKNDMISRQAAIDGKISIQRTNGVEVYSDEAVPVEYLMMLPSAQIERGEWQVDKHHE